MTQPQDRNLAPGDIVMALFPEHVPPGHEQFGYRPAVVVGLADFLGLPRYPVAMVTPLTTHRGQDWAQRSPQLYPAIKAGSGGLPADSLALLDQTRGIGRERVARYLGTLPSEGFRPIQQGLHRLFGLIPEERNPRGARPTGSG